MYVCQSVRVCVSPTWKSTFLHPSTTSTMFQNFTECSRIFQNFPEVPEYSRMFQNVPKCSRMYAECLRMFQNVHSSPDDECGKGIQNIYYQWVLNDAKFWQWFLLTLTIRMFQNVLECSRIYAECSIMFQNVCRMYVCRMFQNVFRMCAECSKMFQNAGPRTCMQLHKLACSYTSLHAVTWAYMQLYISLHAVTWAYMQLHKLKCS